MKSATCATVLVGLATAAQGSIIPKFDACKGIGSNFTLTALYDYHSTPLHLRSYNLGGDFAGLTTSYPKNDTASYLTLGGGGNGDLLVTQSGEFGNQTYQSTYIFNNAEVHMFPQFQEVPEDVDLSLVSKGTKCLLAFKNITTEFGFCPEKDFVYEERSKDVRPFLTYNITGSPNCFSALLEAKEVPKFIL